MSNSGFDNTGFDNAASDNAASDNAASDNTAFDRIAIVNRGEPAMRLINAVREYNLEHGTAIRTIALFTEPDRQAMFVRQADESYLLGSATYENESGQRKVRYLDYERLEEALIETAAGAAWVGWGFVSEHADFAALCERIGVVFIGPTSEAMRQLGDKITSKQLAEAAGVPVAPWSGGAVIDAADARRHADVLGYPVMIKATAGGGGRGIRRVDDPRELDVAFASAQSEAIGAFGDGTLFIESLVAGARHIEVQLIADQHGTVWPVGVRDCSVQRRNQKILEESPSPVLTAEQDAEIRRSAARLGELAGFTNAGTVEFLYDRDSRQFYFMEVNARLQVEHPATELTTGLDLVKLQIAVAQGHRLEGDPPPSSGHAIEARLNAEDPERGFAPAPGRVDLLRLPAGPGIRVDTGIEEGDEIAAEFDSMVAKILAHGRDRAEALARLRRAVEQTTVVVRDGISNKAFLQELLARPEVASSDLDVGWVDRVSDEIARAGSRSADVALIAAAVAAYEHQLAVEIRQFRSSAMRGRPKLEDGLGHTIELRYRGESYDFEVFGTAKQQYRVEIDGSSIDVSTEDLGPRAGLRLQFGDRFHRLISELQGVTHLVEIDGHAHRITHDEGGVIRSPAPGVIVALPVAAGDRVQSGDRLAVIEAMKMETAIVAEFDGVVQEVLVRNNAQVGAGAPLLMVEPSGGSDGDRRGDRISFAGLATPQAVGHEGCRHHLDGLRNMLLGYDVDPAALAADGEGLTPCDDVVGHGELAGLEDEILTLFLDVISVFRREPVEGGDDEMFGPSARRSSKEYLFSYLARPEAAGEGLPSFFLDQLRKTLRHFGVTDLDPGPELEVVLFRLARSHNRMPRQTGPVLSVLEDRLHRRLNAAQDAAIGPLLDRMISETRRRFPAVNDLARELAFRTFDEPFLAEIRRQAYADAEIGVAALEADPTGPDRAVHIAALVDCTQPLKSFLSSRFDRAGVEARQALLEVMTRRYYRQRGLRDMATGQVDGVPYARAAYDHEGATIELFSIHVEFDDMEAAVRSLAAVLDGVSADHEIVLDLYLWRSDPGGSDEIHDRAVELLNERLGDRALRRIVVAVSDPGGGTGMAGVHHFTFRPDGSGGYIDDLSYRDLHPMMGKRLELWRLEAFDIERLPSPEDVYLFYGQARDNARDERLFALAEVRDLTPIRDDEGVVQRAPELERIVAQLLGAIRRVQAHRPDERRLQWNRMILYVWPTIDLSLDDISRLARRLAPDVGDLGLEKVLFLGSFQEGDDTSRRQVFEIDNPGSGGLRVKSRDEADDPLRPLGSYEQKVVRLRQRGVVYPYELIKMLAPQPGAGSGADLPPGRFVEHDVVDGSLVPVERPPGQNMSNIVVGLTSNTTARYPEGMTRVTLLGDPSRGMGNLAEPECHRIMLAIDLAEAMGVPLEWFAISAGALISMESGTENMDWIGRVLRRLIEFTQSGGEVNIVVTGINVGAQPYWNAEATMLMHTRGVLIMTPEGAMVLTGKEALDYSGGVSAEDNLGIGGYERVMGPNGQAQYLARDLGEACRILLRYYEHTYVAPGERFPRQAVTTDPVDRDVCSSPHGGDFVTIGEVFSEATNPDRKRPFEIRRVMAATVDQDHETLERWYGVEDAEIAVVWDAHLGGHPVCLIGLESKNLPRSGFIPADGPDHWTSGTLFPMASKKVARAINAASGSRPLVVLANLSGFDGSPESLRKAQLEYGAEIGRAVVNFEGPIVFCVISRYHGGAFVVFSGTLSDNMEVAAIEGSKASVIGGAPAAAVVFAREVGQRTDADPALEQLRQRIAEADGVERAKLRSELVVLREQIRSEKLGEVAAEFDAIHSVERARQVGSLQAILPPTELRPYLIDAVNRGMARELARLA